MSEFMNFSATVIVTPHSDGPIVVMHIVIRMFIEEKSSLSTGGSNDEQRADLIFSKLGGRCVEVESRVANFGHMPIIGKAPMHIPSNFLSSKFWG